MNHNLKTHKEIESQNRVGDKVLILTFSVVNIINHFGP
jgi:hypothetical protein